MDQTIDLSKYKTFIEHLPLVTKRGRVNRVTGLIIEGDGPAVPIGTTCTLYSNDGSAVTEAEVVGFRDKKVFLMGLSHSTGIEPGSVIESREETPTFEVGPELLGRIIDGVGQPLDEKGPLPSGIKYPLQGKSLNPLNRARITKPLDVGIQSINGLLTCAKGQRIGIMAGTGVGKSVLLGMMARNTEASINVIALIGERGREVKEFVEENLGPEGLAKSVVIAAAADQPPLARLRGAYIATTIAEYFRDQGQDVMLMMDSVTRLAFAQREIGLSVGEPPTTRGYTPSVFSLLPRLLERAGNVEGQGSITGMYTVLVEGDDINEPVSDAVRAILDGHIVLSRKLATHNHYPAIDVLQSISRLMIDVVSKEHYQLSMRFKDILATYKEAEDLINIGAYARGSNPKIDLAIEKINSFNQYLQQGMLEARPLSESIARLKQILEN